MASKLDQILAGATKLSDDRQPHQLAQMVYGEPGVGKTVLGMKLAQALRGDGKILYLDSLEGWVSLEDWPELREGVIRIRVDNPHDLVPMGEGFASDSSKLRNINVVVLDEYSTWVKRVAEQYVRDKNGTPADQMMPEIQGVDWGPIGAIMVSILSKFLSAPRVHVIVIAHSREKGGDTGASKWAPNFTPLLQLDIQGMLHQTTLVTRRLAGRGKYERKLFTTPSANILAKSRVGGMPESPSEDQFIQRTADWTLGKTPSEKGGLSVKAAKAAEKTTDLPEDVPLEGDDTSDLDDKPVIVSE